jgi:hypothetical protein
MNEGTIAKLAGVDEVTAWFGRWPSFHDGEVISIFLARNNESALRIYPYYPQKPATVDFIFQEVTDIDLQDFSRQNVISSLQVETTVDQNGDQVYRVILGPCYGLAGRIDAKGLRFELFPGKSPDGISQW